MKRLDFTATLTAEDACRLRARRNGPRWVIAGLIVAGLAWAASGISLNPSVIKFDPLAVGSGTAYKTVTLTNRNVADFVPTGIVVTGDAANDFKVDTTPCARLEAGDSCEMMVEFRPQRQGERRAQLIVYAADGEQLSTLLSGSSKGTESSRPPQGKPQIRYEPSMLDFSSPNDTQQKLTIENAGDSTLTTQVAVTGQDQEGFAIDQGSCGSVPPGSRCTLAVSLDANFAGANRALSAQVQISHNASNSPAVVPLTWTPTPLPEIHMNPAQLDFASPNQPHQTVVITNQGDGPLQMQFRMAGQNPDRFKLDQSNCEFIPPHGRCALTVSYKPKIFGGNQPVSAQIEISHNAPNMPSPQGVGLSWHPAEHARVTMTPNSSTELGGANGSSVRITVHNEGTVAVKNLIFQLGLLGSGENKQFSDTSNCPTGFRPGSGMHGHR